MREVEAIDLSRFDPYEFRFATHFSLVERLEGKEGYVLIKPVILLSTAPFNATIQNVEIVGTYHSQYTKFIHEKIQAIIAKNCTKVIVGRGQWDASTDASWKRLLTLFPAYEKALETICFAMQMLTFFSNNTVSSIFT